MPRGDAHRPLSNPLRANAFSGIAMPARPEMGSLSVSLNGSPSPAIIPPPPFYDGPRAFLTVTHAPHDPA